MTLPFALLAACNPAQQAGGAPGRITLRAIDTSMEQGIFQLENGSSRRISFEGFPEATGVFTHGSEAECAPVERPDEWSPVERWIGSWTSSQDIQVDSGSKVEVLLDLKNARKRSPAICRVKLRLKGEEVLTSDAFRL